jgi:hypothetical protein
MQANTPKDENAKPQKDEAKAKDEAQKDEPQDAQDGSQSDGELSSDVEGTVIGADGSVVDTAGVEAQPGSAPGAALREEDEANE